VTNNKRKEDFMLLCEKPKIEIYNDDFLKSYNKIKSNSISLIIFDLSLYETNINKLLLLPIFWNIFLNLLTSDGTIICFGKDMFYHRCIIENFEIFRNEIIWVKENNSNLYHENIAIFSKREKILKKKISTVIKYSIDNIHSKPIEMMEYLIKLFSKENDLILDCCCQKGHTLIACKVNQRQCIGFEKDYLLYNQALNFVKKTNILF